LHIRLRNPHFGWIVDVDYEPIITINYTLHQQIKKITREKV